MRTVKSIGFINKYLRPGWEILPPLIWLLILLGMMIMYATAEVLWPFFISIIIAYLFNPLVIRIEQYSINRTISAIAITAFLLLLFGLLITVIGPFLKDEILVLLENMPTYVVKVEDFLNDFVHRHLNTIHEFNIKGQLSKHIATIVPSMFKFISQIFSSGIALANIFILVVVTPVVTFYLLRDWPVMIKGIAGISNVNSNSNIVKFIDQVDISLRSFLQGQIIVCLLLSIFYATSFLLLSLNHVIVLGLIVGFLCFLPFIGTTIGFLLIFTLALGQFGWTFKSSMVFVIFAIGQIIENSFLVPNLVGDNIGVHPVWVIIAVLVGTSLAGVTGMLFALPVTAVTIVIVRFAIKMR